MMILTASIIKYCDIYFVCSNISYLYLILFLLFNLISFYYLTLSDKNILYCHINQFIVNVMQIENGKECAKYSKILLLCQKTRKALKNYSMIVGLLVYVCLCAMLYLWGKRFLTFALLVMTCCFFKSNLMRNVLIVCSVALLVAIYCIKGQQFGYSIFSFMGLTTNTVAPAKFDDHFVDESGYCYFVLRAEKTKYTDILNYIEELDTETTNLDFVKEFMEYLFDVTRLDQKIGLYVRHADTLITIGYDGKYLKHVEKSHNIFGCNILPYKTFETFDVIDNLDLESSKIILCFNLPKSGDAYQEYAKEAVKSDYDGLFYLAKRYLSSATGRNNNQIVEVFCHKDKTMKTIKIEYDQVFEFNFNQ